MPLRQNEAEAQAHSHEDHDQGTPTHVSAAAKDAGHGPSSVQLCNGAHAIMRTPVKPSSSHVGKVHLLHKVHLPFRGP